MVEADPGVSIAAVERETGLGKDLLRVWEKRYGFPQPLRDAYGERIYPPDQVEKLRLLRRLVDEGHRPGKIAGLSLEELRPLKRVSGDLAQVRPAEVSPDLQAIIDILMTHQIDALRANLSGHVMRRGLERFIVEIAAPLCRLVGDSWARGDLQIFEEHLFTEELTRVLRVVLEPVVRSASGVQLRPQVLLTTLPGEPHGLGLLMAEALMRLNGCACLSLGQQTPISEVGRAVQAQRIDIVALSFSAWFNASQVVDALGELARQLDPCVEIWAGGGNAALARTLDDRIHVTRDLPAIARAVDAWRQRHA